MYVGGKDLLIENSPKCKEDQFSNTPPMTQYEIKFNKHNGYPKLADAV